ncbi:hypothetical protein ACJ73_07163, partial [Blastomyces percursus]
TSVAPASPPRQPSPPQKLVLPKFREQAVRDYCKWLESKVTNEAYKDDFQKICDVTLDNHLDLELILEDPDPNLFVK